MLNTSRFHGQIELRCHKISLLNCSLQTLKNAIRLVESRELPVTACALMTRLPVLFGRKPSRALAAISPALEEVATVIGLIAPHDEVLPTL